MTTLKQRDEWMKALLASGEHETIQRVGLRLALYLNITTGRCDPSYRALVRDLGGKLVERTVIRAINDLVDRHWIDRDSRPGATNRFHLLPPEGVTLRCHPPASFRGDTLMSPKQRSEYRRGPNRENKQGGARGSAPRCAFSLAGPRGNRFYVGTNPRRNRLTHADMLEIRALCERDDLTEEELGREFDRIEERANRRPKRRRHPRPSDDWPDDYRMQFWDAFPNRVGKKPALAALGRLRRRKQGKPTWAELIDGVHRYIEWHRAYGNGDNKWLNPKTWIVEERWNDQPAP